MRATMGQSPHENRNRTDSEGYLMPESDFNEIESGKGIQMTSMAAESRGDWNNDHLSHSSMMSSRGQQAQSPRSHLGIIKDSIEHVHRRHGITIKYYFRWTLIIIVLSATIILLSGIIAFIEDWTFLEAVYFCAITVTTVGFGDLTPRQDASKLLTCLLIAASLVIIASVLTRMQHVILKNYEDAISDDSALKNITETPGKRLTIYFSCLAILTLVSTIFLHSNSEDGEGLSWVDSFYYSVVTMTTVGFGDVVPSHKSGRIFTIVLVAIGPLLLGRTITAFVEVFSETVEEMKQNYEIGSRQAALQTNSFFSLNDENRDRGYPKYDGDDGVGGVGDDGGGSSGGGVYRDHSPIRSIDYSPEKRIISSARSTFGRSRQRIISNHSRAENALLSSSRGAASMEDDLDESESYDSDEIKQENSIRSQHHQKGTLNTRLDSAKRVSHHGSRDGEVEDSLLNQSLNQKIPTIPMTNKNNKTITSKVVSRESPSSSLSSSSRQSDHASSLITPKASRDVDLVLKYLLEESVINESHIQAVTSKLRDASFHSI